MNKRDKDLQNEKLRRIKERLKGKKSPPVRCMIFLTNRCNLCCLYCTSRNNEINQKEFSNERLLEIVHESKEMGVLEWRISGGGEPLMHKSAILMISEIKKLDMCCELITNGTLIDKNVARKLVETGLDVLSLSIDSAEKSIQDFLRGEDSYKNIIKGTKYVNYWKKRLKKDRPNISFLTVITNKNYDKLLKLFKLAEKCGCSNISLNPLNVNNDSSKALSLSYDQKKLLQNYMNSLKERNNRKIFNDLEILLPLPIFYENTDTKSSTNKKDNINKLHCLEPLYSIQILPNGKVSPCCLGFSMKGNNLNKQSLREVWNGNEYTNLRKCLLEGKIYPVCKDCIETTRSESDRIRKG